MARRPGGPPVRWFAGSLVRWFADGTLNAAYNAVDRHVAADGGYRRGAPSALKPTVDEALSGR